MEKFKLFITEQLKNAPEAEVKYRIGKQDFDNAPRTSDNTTLEMLIKGYADIAILRNAVAYEALKSVDAIKAPKVLTTSMGIASGDKLIWPAELGNTIWNGRRSPRLYTPFPNTMRADVEIANRDKKSSSPVPMMNKIEEPLGKANMNKVLDDFFANGENPEQGPAFYGDINMEDIPNGRMKWNTGEWKLGSGSKFGATEYGIWASSRIYDLYQYEEDYNIISEWENFIRNFNQ